MGHSEKKGDIRNICAVVTQNHVISCAVGAYMLSAKSDQTLQFES